MFFEVAKEAGGEFRDMFRLGANGKEERKVTCYQPCNDLYLGSLGKLTSIMGFAEFFACRLLCCVVVLFSHGLTQEAQHDFWKLLHITQDILKGKAKSHGKNRKTGKNLNGEAENKDV